MVSYILNIIGIVSLIAALFPLGYGLYSHKINGFDKSIRFLNIMLGIIGLSISFLSFYLSTNNEFLSLFHLWNLTLNKLMKRCALVFVGIDIN